MENAWFIVSIFNTQFPKKNSILSMVLVFVRVHVCYDPPNNAQYRVGSRRLW